MEPDSIIAATDDSDYAAFALLIREYWDWLHHRYAAAPGTIDAIASHQGLEDELAALSTSYGPPRGVGPCWPCGTAR